MRTTLATAIPLLLILWAGPLGAAWRANAAGTGAAAARTLGGPTAVTAVAPSSSTVVVGWSAPITGPVPDGYTVRRLAPSTGVVCAVDAATLKCVDSGLAAATSYSYAVEARLGSWSSVPSGPVSVTTPVPGPYLVSVGTGARTAGAAFTATITATTDGTTVDTTYTGTRVVSFSGPAASPSGQTPSYPTSVSFTAGVGLASITLYDAGNVTLVATDGATQRLDAGRGQHRYRDATSVHLVDAVLCRRRRRRGERRQVPQPGEPVRRIPEPGHPERRLAPGDDHPQPGDRDAQPLVAEHHEREHRVVAAVPIQAAERQPAVGDRGCRGTRPHGCDLRRQPFLTPQSPGGEVGFLPESANRASARLRLALRHGCPGSTASIAAGRHDQAVRGPV